jgi:hypothetical protein
MTTTKPRLKMFALPATFPAFMVPEKVRQFVTMTRKGMTKDELVKLAEDKGFEPLWQHLPNMGDNIFGFGLDVSGLVVPLIVDMNYEESGHGALH